MNFDKYFQLYEHHCNQCFITWESSLLHHPTPGGQSASALLSIPAVCQSLLCQSGPHHGAVLTRFPFYTLTLPPGARSAIACTLSLLRTLAQVTPSSMPPPPTNTRLLKALEQGLRLITGVKAASSPLLNSRPRADRSAGVLLVTVFPRTEKMLCQSLLN